MWKKANKNKSYKQGSNLEMYDKENKADLTCTVSYVINFNN